MLVVRNQNSFEYPEYPDSTFGNKKRLWWETLQNALEEEPCV